MGQRANLILVSNNKYDLYYNHYCANSLEMYIFWGEPYLIDFFRQHAPQDHSSWLDTVWCEGGAVVDLDRKILLFFGGNVIPYDIQVRDIYLALLQYTWPGYTIRWAENHIVDLAEYVGVAPEEVIHPTHLSPSTTVSDDLILRTFAPPGKTNYIKRIAKRLVDIKNNLTNSDTSCVSKEIFFNDSNGVCSLVQTDNNMSFYDINSLGIDLEVLLGGQRLLDCLEQCKPSHPESIIYFGDNPINGAHIDLRNKELYFWSATPFFMQNMLPDLWPNWKITSWSSDYTQHIKITHGKLSLPIKTLKSILTEIEQMVCCIADPGNPEHYNSFIEYHTSYHSEPNSYKYSKQCFNFPKNPKQIFDQVKNSYIQSICLQGGIS